MPVTGPLLRPRDFVETADGILAAVTSTAHAEGPVVTVRYVREDGVPRKLEAVAAAALVSRRHPAWLRRSPLLDLDVVLVPHAEVVRVHHPEARLAVLRAGAHAEGPEARAVRAASMLERGDAPPGRLGVTGSLLVGAARAGSDLDIVAYGRATFQAARRALADAVARGDWQELSAAEWREAWRRRGAPGTLDGYVRAERRKHTKALVEGTRLDLTLLQDPTEGEPEHPPFVKLGRTRIEATVTDAAAAFDLPARFRVDDNGVPEVVSYTATYAGQALEGERIGAAGWLEEDARGRRRLLVGTSREATGEWIRLLTRL
jgi:predicted nucleotidyltransferase